MINLFMSGDFNLHSGGNSNIKIECDALTSEDWDTIARIISDKYDFKFVSGIPTGGDKLQEALAKYEDREGESNVVLIVDDVLTTGGSMVKYRDNLEHYFPNYEYKGVVLFARGECPDWVEPIFKMWKGI
jgi:hypoxanthine phosphoribosyltransferase